MVATAAAAVKWGSAMPDKWLPCKCKIVRNHIFKSLATSNDTIITPHKLLDLHMRSDYSSAVAPLDARRKV